ncbi:MAG: RluA family pseudouridine synthase, partial [Lactobacillus iners]|nr:RluA family pseudouridine synthase [Lactobacillus iners]
MPSLDMSMTKNADFYKLVYREKRPQKVADFLLTKGFSKRSLINCRHRGGNVL